MRTSETLLSAAGGGGQLIMLSAAKHLKGHGDSPFAAAQGYKTGPFHETMCDLCSSAQLPVP